MTKDLPYVWLEAINDILTNGDEVAPRGQLTRELLQRTMVVDMRRPVLTVPQRKLSYQFMAAEAYWILTGDNRVSTIAPYNKHISQFSDDGETFFGAYGPKIMSQLQYVVSKLLLDLDTRQAGLTIWRECPPATKDVPCTVAVFFNIRNNKLNCHTFMRSSDVWLGVPYDVFNFSMLSHMVCCLLNGDLNADGPITPGDLHLTAASSHLYERNFEAARECLTAEVLDQQLTPEALFTDSEKFSKWLKDLRDTKPGTTFLRWWEN
jgi:thymidylate synthase